MVYNTENLDELMVRSYNVHYYINDSELSDGYDAWWEFVFIIIV